VHALLAKPLDWCVIQLARRCVRRGAGRPPACSKEEAPSVLPEPDFRAENASEPADLAFGAEGRFRFTSPVRTGAPENNTVHGRLYSTGGDWKGRPTVVLLHGWDAQWCYHRTFPRLARRLRRAGINTAAFELPYHMQRRPRTGPVVDFISGDLERMLEATRQAVAETRALCHWLRGQGSGVIGIWGFSLGAWLAGLTLWAEPRLSCAVLTTPIASIERAIAELPFCAPVRGSLQRRTVELRSLNLGAHTPDLAPNNVLLVESRHDLFAPPDSIEELWRAWGHPQIWRLPHGHISVLFSPSVMKRTVHWLAERMQSAALT
jgi:pimeloyl-ACP methyl ester carboxylesterase